MEMPEFVQDKYDRIWEWNHWGGMYKCITNNSLREQTLVELNQKCGPIHSLNRGNKVEPPFKPIANGTWVEFENDLPSTVAGRIHSYDDGKLFYEVIVIVGRNDVRETP